MSLCSRLFPIYLSNHSKTMFFRLSSVKDDVFQIVFGARDGPPPSLAPPLSGKSVKRRLTIRYWRFSITWLARSIGLSFVGSYSQCRSNMERSRPSSAAILSLRIGRSCLWSPISTTFSIAAEAEFSSTGTSGTRVSGSVHMPASSIITCGTNRFDFSIELNGGIQFR